MKDDVDPCSSLRATKGGAAISFVIPEIRNREFVSEVIPREFNSEFPVNASTAGRNPR